VIHAVALHMHLLGKRGRLELVHPDGRVETLLSIPRWRFNWQSGYYLASPVLFRPGDLLRVECNYDNSAANQPVHHGVREKPKLVLWGVKSSDEMCSTFLYISEP
jgi:hypothetical protein